MAHSGRLQFTEPELAQVPKAHKLQPEAFRASTAWSCMAGVERHTGTLRRTIEQFNGAEWGRYCKDPEDMDRRCSCSCSRRIIILINTKFYVAEDVGLTDGGRP